MNKNEIIDDILKNSPSRLRESYFSKNYPIITDEIINYTSIQDITFKERNLYKKLGFNYTHRTKPNYWWVIDGVRHHRFTWNKKRLVKEGADSNKTGVEIMYNMGYFRIFGCGQDKYTYE